MLRFRSFLAVILALVATFLVSCGSPEAKAPPTYTEAKLAEIQVFTPRLEEFRDRLPELQDLIERGRWVDVGTFIHGPLGDLRRNMSNLARTLLPADQKAALKLTNELLEDLVGIDEAAAEGNTSEALVNYRAAVSDFDSFLELIPQG